MTISGDARIVLALDTSTDMLCCSVATWTPQPDGTADVQVLAGGDHLHPGRHPGIKLPGENRY